MIAALPTSQPLTGSRPAEMARTIQATALGVGTKLGAGTARGAGLLVGGWLPDMDLNHDKQIQSLLCYRYTIGQAGNAENVKISD